MHFSELPQEVHDLIVDFAVPEGNYVGRDTTVPTCALVSRCLTARAQWHIFKHIKLILAKDLLIFESKLTSSPRLGAYTTIFVVAIRRIGPNVVPSHERKLEALARILKACPNVEKLHVLVDETLSPLFMATLGSIGSLRSLRHIHLQGAGRGRVAPWNVFEGFCSLAQTLDILELSSMELSLGESERNAFALPSVKCLEASKSSVDEGSFVRLISTLKGSLEELVIKHPFGLLLHRMVHASAVGSSLRHLSIIGLMDGKRSLRPILKSSSFPRTLVGTDTMQTADFSSCVNLTELYLSRMGRSDDGLLWEPYSEVCHVLENVGSRSLQRVRVDIDLDFCSLASPWAGNDIEWDRLVCALSASRQPSLERFTVTAVEKKRTLEVIPDWPTTLRQQLRGLPDQVSLRIERRNRYFLEELHSLV